MFTLNEWVIDPCLMYKKIFFSLTFFGHVLTILALTKRRLVTIHVLSSTYFHSCFFITFAFKFYLCQKFELSIKDYLLLIYTFMCMIIFLRIIIISFVSHQTRILNAGLGMTGNRYGLSWRVGIAYSIWPANSPHFT